MYNLKDLFEGKYDEEFTALLGDKKEIFIPGDQLEKIEGIDEPDWGIRIVAAHKESSFWNFSSFHNGEGTMSWSTEVPAMAWVRHFDAHVLGTEEPGRYEKEVLEVIEDLKKSKEYWAKRDARKAQWNKDYAEVQKVRKTELFKRLVPYLLDHPLYWAIKLSKIDPDDPVWTDADEVPVEDPRIQKRWFDGRAEFERGWFAEFLIYQYGNQLKRTSSPGWFSKQLWELLHKK